MITYSSGTGSRSTELLVMLAKEWEIHCQHKPTQANAKNIVNILLTTWAHLAHFGVEHKDILRIFWQNFPAIMMMSIIYMVSGGGGNDGSVYYDMC